MRKSATMIELIFTMVILAIAMTAIPAVLSQNVKSNEFSLNQEAYLAGATKMGNILSYDWDENNTGDQEIKYVLDVTNGDSELDRYPDNTSKYRKGHIREKYRRSFDSNESNASTNLGFETNDNSIPDDIDDFNGQESNLTAASAESDYVKSFRFHTNVYYVDDTADYSNINISFDFDTQSKTASTNLKMIEVEIRESDTDEVIATFRSYAANIGTTKLLSRSF